MKLLIAKELDSDNVEEFLSCIDSQYDTETVFLDTSIDNRFKDVPGVVSVPFEDRSNMKNIILQIAQKSNCQAFMTFFKNTTPKSNIVTALFEPLQDVNIGATYCDYMADGVPIVQGIPTLICRRIEACDGDLYDLTKCKGIVKYIPMVLYDIQT